MEIWASSLRTIKSSCLRSPEEVKEIYRKEHSLCFNTPRVLVSAPLKDVFLFPDLSHRCPVFAVKRFLAKFHIAIQQFQQLTMLQQRNVFQTTSQRISASSFQLDHPKARATDLFGLLLLVPSAPQLVGLLDHPRVGFAPRPNFLALFRALPTRQPCSLEIQGRGPQPRYLLGLLSRNTILLIISWDGPLSPPPDPPSACPSLTRSACDAPLQQLGVPAHRTAGAEAFLRRPGRQLPGRPPAARAPEEAAHQAEHDRRLRGDALVPRVDDVAPLRAG